MSNEIEKQYYQYVEKAKKEGDTDIKSYKDWHYLVYGHWGFSG